MKQTVCTICSNEPVADKVFRMALSGDTSAMLRPGQFVNIKIEGRYLRRPFSVADWDARGFTVLYKTVGAGTGEMARMEPGQTLDVLTGLGNGYDMDAAAGKRILLAGGGCGVPPLLGLGKRLRARGERVSAALGFDRAASVFGAAELERSGIPVLVATEDGSAGVRGFVTELIKENDFDYYFACGPEPMLRAVHALGKQGQLSFEERMGCGFGVCMGCSCETLAGPKRICADGPVMRSEEVRF